MMSRTLCVWGVLMMCLVLPVSAQDTTPEGPTAPPPRPQVGRNHSGFGTIPRPTTVRFLDNAGLLSPAEEEPHRTLAVAGRVQDRRGDRRGHDRVGPGLPGRRGPLDRGVRDPLFNAYGIGNLPQNDGVLLLIARNDRKARIELGAGYNPAEDRDAANIMNSDIVPRFKQGAYAEGITDGVRAIMLEFAGVRVGVNWTLIGLLVSVPVVGLIAYSLFRSGKRGWGWIAVGLLIVLLLALFTIMIKTARSIPSGGGSSGGFGGGFGGGFSGGSSATGSW